MAGGGGAGKETTANEEEERKNPKPIPGPLQGSVHMVTPELQGARHYELGGEGGCAWAGLDIFKYVRVKCVLCLKTIGILSHMPAILSRGCKRDPAWHAGKH